MNRSPFRPAPRGVLALFSVLSVSALAALSSLNHPLSAQLPSPEEKPSVGARMPALSPDGKQVAFVWRGDIWVCPATGGRAYQATSHVELDAYPVWSPDGNWLAFSSLRNGNWDIFVVPSTGGSPRQITFGSGAEIVSDWSPDGKTLLFSGASRDVSGNSAMYSIDLATLRFTELNEDYRSLDNPNYAPDGKRIAFQRDSFPWTRPRYHGSRAAQLWTLDTSTGQPKEISNTGRQHLWPHFTADGKGIVCVTAAEETPNAQFLNKPPLKLVDNAKITPNLFLFPAGGGGPKQLTSFVGDGVRCPTVARKSGDIAFEYRDSLYILGPNDKEPKKLTIICNADDKENSLAREVITNSGVEEAEPSPDGKTFAFVLRGELWTIPIDKAKTRNADIARRLTENPGFDRDFVWSKDGKTIYYISDQNGIDSLYAMEVETRAIRPIYQGKDAVNSPKLSPDGTVLAFWVEGPTGADGKGSGGLYSVATTGTPTPRRVMAVPGAAQRSFSISPDNKWFAVTHRNVESNAVNIHLIPADGSKAPVNVTRLNATHSAPTWSPDGKYLFFLSDRDGSGDSPDVALYVLPLLPEDARTDELDLKYQKPTQAPAVQVDFTGINERIRRLSLTPAPTSEIVFSPETGMFFYTVAGDIYMAAYDGTNSRRLTAPPELPSAGPTTTPAPGGRRRGFGAPPAPGGGTPAAVPTGAPIRNLRLGADGRTLFFTRGGALFTMRLAPPFGQTPVTFTAEWERDLNQERKAAFEQFYRGYATGFYDPNFHGRDWTAIKAKYEALLPSVGTRLEFSTLLNRMVGELESSHSEVSAAPSPVISPVSRNLGVYFDYSYTGPGIKVKDVPKRAPGSYAKTRIKPGEYILEVDGKPVTLDENLYKALNDKGERDFVLTVNDKPTKEGSHTVTYKALTAAEWSQIHYQNRIERSREAVDKASGGTVAYVHIAGMGDANQTLFEKELYEYAEGKKAVIIDVRWNGGGSIADNLLNWLAIKPYRIRFSRDDYPAKDANNSFFVRAVHLWDKPIVVLMNEYSLSNAEIFPYVIKENRLGKLVGMPTPGYVISTGGLPLVDGTVARMPGGANFRKDGSPMENLGERPDIMVPYPTTDWLAGRDPQLSKAVELLK